MTTYTEVPRLTRRLLLLAAPLCCLAVALPLPAAEPTPALSGPHLTLAAGSRLWLEGSSTLHAYSSSTSQVEVAVEIGGASGAPADLRSTLAGGGLKALRVDVPISTLKSGESGLDKNLQKALKAETVPVIRFRLTSYTAAEGKDGALLITARGRLAIAGVENDEIVEATCRPTSDGLEVTGAKELKMSDFGVKPPTLFLGTLKTADKIVVHFALKLKA